MMNQELTAARILEKGGAPLQDGLNWLQRALSNPCSRAHLPRIMLAHVPEPSRVRSLSLGSYSGPHARMVRRDICAACNSGRGEHHGIPGEPEQGPEITLSHVAVSGMTNLVPTALTSSAGAVRTVVADLAFGAVTGAVDGRVLSSSVRLSGRFRLAQACCPSIDGRSSSGPAREAVIAGEFETIIHSATGTAVFRVEPNDARGTAIELTSLAFHASTRGDAIKTRVNVGHVPSWERLEHVAETVLNDPTTKAVLIGKVSAAVNDTALRERLSRIVSQHARAAGL